MNGGGDDGGGGDSLQDGSDESRKRSFSYDEDGSVVLMYLNRFAKKLWLSKSKRR